MLYQGSLKLTRLSALFISLLSDYHGPLGQVTVAGHLFVVRFDDFIHLIG